MSEREIEDPELLSKIKPRFTVVTEPDVVAPKALSDEPPAPKLLRPPVVLEPLVEM